jgi:hypothetical protein
MKTIPEPQTRKQPLSAEGQEVERTDHLPSSFLVLENRNVTSIPDAPLRNLETVRIVQTHCILYMYITKLLIPIMMHILLIK